MIRFPNLQGLLLYIYDVILQDGSAARKRKTRHSSNPPMEEHVGWIMDKRAHRERLESLRYHF